MVSSKRVGVEVDLHVGLRAVLVPAVLLAPRGQVNRQWGLELHMDRSTLLKSTHYAGQWVVREKDRRNHLQVVNLLGP